VWVVNSVSLTARELSTVLPWQRVSCQQCYLDSVWTVNSVTLTACELSTVLPWQRVNCPAEQVDSVAAGHGWQSTDVLEPAAGWCAGEGQCVASVSRGPWLSTTQRPSCLHSVPTYPHQCVQGSARPSPQDHWQMVFDCTRHSVHVTSQTTQRFNTTQLPSITEHKQASITANNTWHVIKCAAALNSTNTIHAAKTPTKATDTV